MIITIDGIDGVGKSSVASLLKENSDTKIIKGVRDVYVDKLAYDSKHIDVRCLYYLASFLDSVLDAKEAKSKYIIYDKSYYSTIVYHRLLGSKINLDDTITKLVSPDLKIYLTCNRKLWEKRLRSRNKIDWYEEQLLTNINLAEKIELLYSELGLIRIVNNDLNDTVFKIKEMMTKLERK